MNISERTIKQCSLTLGQFDSESVNLLVTLYHHQNSCSPLIRLSNNLKEKFENLLTSKRDDDEIYNDTPLTRIELAIMIHFKQKYLSEPIIDPDDKQLKSNLIFSIDDELNLAYCFLLAQIDDRLSEDLLNEIKFLFKIQEQESIRSLFDIYQKLHQKFSRFFSLLIERQCFAEKLVAVHQLIPAFQLFIKRYEDFIVTFDKQYKSLPDNANNCTQTDNIVRQNNTQETPSVVSKVVTTKPLSENQQQQPITSILIQPVSNLSASRSLIQQTISSSSNVPRKALCVIINITAFISSQSIHTPKRTGSDKDVDLIKVVFNKLNFIVLKCNFDFKKTDLNAALDQIDDQNEYGDCDCLVMFIMSHGLLHSFFTADSEEVIIRDIIKRYTDSSPTTIWKGKPRMFFIQACRSLWPEHVPSNNREGVKQSDLSPRMLVAYSCSANEASKRIPTVGSIFIQILCIMILRCGSFYSIQYILECTAKFVMKRDECIAEYKKTQVNIQQPEYVDRQFSPNFRFSHHCLFNKYHSWTDDKKSILETPLGIWQEIYDLIYGEPIVHRK